MRHFTTTTENGGLDRLIKEIWEAEKKTRFESKLFHVYAGISDEETLTELMAKISKAFPDAPIVGSQSGGEMHGGERKEFVVVVSCLAFEKSKVEVVTYDDLSGNEREIGRRLRRDTNRRLSQDLKAVEILLPGALLNTSETYEELGKADPDVLIFGGYAGNDDLDLEATFVMTNGEILRDSLVATFYFGSDLHLNASKSAGWQRLGLPLKITKANGNVLNEIDGMPAAEAYEKYLNLKNDGKFAENTNEFPIAAYVNGEELLRHTNAVLADGSLQLAGNVETGWEAYLTFGNPSGIIERVNSRLVEANAFAPEAILIYSCYVRKVFWERFASVEVAPFSELAPATGFYTFGEVLRNMRTSDIMEYNVTMLTILMREGEAAERTAPAPKIDDDALTGQASMIRRLAELVSSSAAEVQTAYRKLEEANGRLQYASEHDHLTGLFNRGKIDEEIENMLERTAKAGGLSSLIMFDVDRFKRINDDFGHKAGDDVLRKFSSILRMEADSMKGFAGRVGGEEFYVLLPNCETSEAVEFAEKTRRIIETTDFGIVGKVTASAGVTGTDGRENRRTLCSRVDSAMYASKNGGRNRVSVS